MGLPLETVPPRWAWTCGSAAWALAAAGRENGGNEGGAGASRDTLLGECGHRFGRISPEVGPALGLGRMDRTELGRTALDHLWLHFTEMGRYSGPADLQVIVKGDGCYLEDANGRRYLDALAGLFCVNVGYGYGEEMGEAAAAQMRELPFAINWTFAHPRAIELAGELAEPRPGRPQPRLLRLRRLRGRRGRLEARPPVPRRPRRAALEGDRPADRLPRDHHGRALDHRLHRAAHALRAARPGRAARVQHEPLPPPARRDRGGVHRGSCSTTSRPRSSRPAPTPSPW